MRDRWHRLPTWLRWLVGSVYVLIVCVVTGAVLSTDGVGEGWRWAALVAVAAISFGINHLVSDNRLGGRGQTRLLRRSSTAGRVLDGADRERWSVEVPRQARFLREHDVFSKIVFVLVTSLAVLALAPLADRGIRTVALAGAPFFLLAVVFAVVVFWWGPRRRRRLDALEQSLTESSGGGEERSSDG